MLDPNIRPAFIPDRGKHLAHIQRVIAMADILKLSDEDTRLVRRHRCAEEQRSAQWLELSPKLVVMARGSRAPPAIPKPQVPISTKLP